MHLSDGLLRRSIDEPFAVHPGQRSHLDSCPRCQTRAGAIRADAQVAASLLATAPLAAPARPSPSDTRAALARLQPRMTEAPGRRGRTAWLRDPRRGARATRWSAAGAGVAAVALMLVAAGVPQDFITIFQPSRLAPVAVDASDLGVLQELSHYGDVSGVPRPSVTPVTAAQARAETGVALPASLPLPAGIPATPSYYVVSGGTVTFTFDAAKAQAAARQHGATLPPMPAAISGSTLQLVIHPTLVAAYGLNLGAISQLAGLGNAHQQQGAASAPASSVPAAGAAAPGASGPAGAGPSLSGVVIVASPAPTVRSSGATATQIEDYLLAQPGVSPALASEVRALGDPSKTLPVPVPVDMTGAAQVTIGGDRGLMVGDPTGPGSLAVWLHGGIVYCVAGSLSSTETLRIADSIG